MQGVALESGLEGEEGESERREWMDDIRAACWFGLADDGWREEDVVGSD